MSVCTADDHHSMHSQQISRMNRHLAETIEPGSLLQLRELLQLEVCSLSPSSASCTGLASAPTCHSTCTRQQKRKHLSTCFLSLHHCLSFSCLCPYLPFLALSLRACVRGRVPPKVIIVSLCQRTHSHASTRSLVRLTICQGNHLQEITVGCWRVPSQSLLGPPAAGLDLRQFCIVQRPSPRKQACHHERCCAISDFAIILFFEHLPRFQSTATFFSSSNPHGSERACCSFRDHGHSSKLSVWWYQTLNHRKQRKNWRSVRTVSETQK